MKRDYRKLDRMYESHDAGAIQIPQEVLSMTVGDMLKKLEETDTVETSNYETIEDAILSCLDCLVPGGYAQTDPYAAIGSVEGASSEYETPENPSNPEEMVSFGDMNQSLEGQDRTSLDDWSF